jgi:hypothetical protein
MSVAASAIAPSARSEVMRRSIGVAAGAPVNDDGRSRAHA